MDKEEFIKKMTELIRETYPVTEDIVRSSIEAMIAGEKPQSVIDTMVKDNLEYLEAQ